MRGHPHHPLHDATCPSWCVVDHRHDDPGEPWHDSATTFVPVLLGVRSDGAERPVDTELALVATRHGTGRTWLLVGEPERSGQHLVLSPESAARVASALSGLAAATLGTATDESVER